MANNIVQCPQCGANLSVPAMMTGKQGRCPKCKTVFVIGATGAAAALEEARPTSTISPTSPTSQTSPTSPTMPPPVPPPTMEPELPENMKVNRRIAGRVCPHCNKALDLGEDAFNCPFCGGSMHAACRAAAGGCANPACSRTVAAPTSPTGYRLAAPAGPVPVAAPVSDEVACRFCGERIKIGARKCRHCNEFQLDADRARITASQADEKLVWWEILIGIGSGFLFCGTAGIILGIVYSAQGKKKGWKLIAISVAAAAALFVIFFIIGMIGSMSHG